MNTKKMKKDIVKGITYIFGKENMKKDILETLCFTWAAAILTVLFVFGTDVIRDVVLSDLSKIELFTTGGLFLITYLLIAYIIIFKLRLPYSIPFLLIYIGVVSKNYMIMDIGVVSINILILLVLYHILLELIDMFNKPKVRK